MDLRLETLTCRRFTLIIKNNFPASKTYIEPCLCKCQKKPHQSSLPLSIHKNWQGFLIQENKFFKPALFSLYITQPLKIKKSKKDS